MNIFMVVVTILLALAVQQLIIERQRRIREAAEYQKSIAELKAVNERRDNQAERHREKLTDAWATAAHQRRVYEQLPEPKENKVERPKEYQRIV